MLVLEWHRLLRRILDVLLLFVNSFRRTACLTFWKSDRILLWIHVTLYLIHKRDFYRYLVSSFIIDLFRMFIFSWFSFGGFTESRNLSTSKFSSLMEFRLLKYSLITFWVSLGLLWCFPDHLSICSLESSLSFSYLDQESIKLVYLLEEPALRFVVSLYFSVSICFSAYIFFIISCC